MQIGAKKHIYTLCMLKTTEYKLYNCITIYKMKYQTFIEVEKQTAKPS